jgi:hypothetical protein
MVTFILKEEANTGYIQYSQSNKLPEPGLQRLSRCYYSLVYQGVLVFLVRFFFAHLRHLYRPATIENNKARAAMTDPAIVAILAEFPKEALCWSEEATMVAVGLRTSIAIRVRADIAEVVLSDEDSGTGICWTNGSLAGYDFGIGILLTNIVVINKYLPMNEKCSYLQGIDFHTQ